MARSQNTIGGMMQDNATIVYTTRGCVTEGIMHSSETATFLNPTLPENVFSTEETKDGGKEKDWRQETPICDPWAQGSNCGSLQETFVVCIFNGILIFVMQKSNVINM